MRKAIDKLMETWWDEFSKEHCFFTESEEYKKAEELFSRIDDMLYDIGEYDEVLRERGDE